MDNNFEEINSDNDFGEDKNNDYDLNIIYKEVVKNLEDIKINENQRKEIEYSQRSEKIDDLSLNIKAKKEKVTVVKVVEVIRWKTKGKLKVEKKRNIQKNKFKWYLIKLS